MIVAQMLSDFKIKHLPLEPPINYCAHTFSRYEVSYLHLFLK